MLARLDDWFEHLRPLPLAAVAVVGVAVLAAVDYFTGYELSFSIFYLGPIALAAWYGGRRMAVTFCLLSAATWLTVDLATGHPYSRAWYPFWNAGVRLGFFSISAGLLVTVRRHLVAERRLARRDGLTGLLNGRAFRESAGTQIALASRSGRPLALGYIDLDDFKRINDSLGHAAGDRVLVEVAAVLGDRLRRTDLACRLGGDEFAVLLPDTEARGARRVFDGFAAALRIELEARDLPCGASIGVACFETPPASLDEALRAADEQLYEAKGGGKGKVVYRVVEATTVAV